MTNEDAVNLAIGAVKDGGCRIGTKPIWSNRFEQNTRGSDHRSGWIVAVPILVPKGFETDTIYVEVFEPDGEVNILYTI